MQTTQVLLFKKKGREYLLSVRTEENSLSAQKKCHNYALCRYQPQLRLQLDKSWVCGSTMPQCCPSGPPPRAMSLLRGLEPSLVPAPLNDTSCSAWCRW